MRAQPTHGDRPAAQETRTAHARSSQRPRHPWSPRALASPRALLLALGAVTLLLALIGLATPALAQDVAQLAADPAAAIDGMQININAGDQTHGVLKLVILLTILSLVPAMLMTMTCFTRIIIVFGFLRQALGTQQSPPNQVLIGLSLFMTLFVMTPTLSQIEQEAYAPYIAGELSTTEALDAGSKPLKKFMLKHTYDKDLALFFQVSKRPKPQTARDVPMTVLVPAFILSELKTAFQIGFLIYIPFLMVDMLVASVLMSMGMMMLPPVIISLPFKLLLFVMIDGWYLVVGTLLQSFA
ncbi:MAG: flagellar biosynthetic protein FliP [Myxococcales bacterium]|nr:flagellar biosynthetic protein FliP [Myxococcales bacterium]